MAITQVGTVHTFAFADGNGGHLCDFGSAPAAGQWDVLCVNSNTVVTTPSGWTLTRSRVGNQGAYVYTRKAAGGEAQSVTVTTSGNHDTQVTWSRWAGADAIDIADHAAADAAAGSTTPALTTAALATTGELLIAFGAVHGAVTSSPVWSSGYTPIAATTQGSGVTTATGYVATKNPAGTAAESPNVSWTTPAPDRYIFAVSLTPTAASTASDSDTGTGADAGTVTATTSSSDTAAGADAGAATAQLSASDTATGADAGAVPSVMVVADDTASAAEADSAAAATTAADSGYGDDTANTSASCTAAETGAATDTGSLTAVVGGADTGHAADAGAVGTAPAAPPARGHPNLHPAIGSEVRLR
ncbi:hypothetical protein [Actinomadura litoris]|uniref:hypothetical protein n=1 Tax=Actinomadura litoris TaxID=2678616 RepID=UPI001FA6CA38|nr:hypothetical protein [Actinomadura litoris]